MPLQQVLASLDRKENGEAMRLMASAATDRVVAWGRLMVIILHPIVPYQPLPKVGL